MSILDKVRGYQRLASTINQQETTGTPQLSTPGSLPGGGTSEQTGNSFLQQFILGMLKEKGVPVQALKLIPGFGEQVHKLLYGDPYQCHTYFADMIYQVEQLLEKDKAWDPVARAREAEFAAAEKRAQARADEAFWTGNHRAFDASGIGSVEPSASGPIDGPWKNGIGQEHFIGSTTQEVLGALPNLQSLNSGQQTEIQSAVEYGRPDREQAL